MGFKFNGVYGTLDLSGSSGGSGASALNDLSDVTLTSLSTDELLFTQDGSTFINQTLAEAGISAVGHSHVATDITDFDTEVSNNASVTANTAKISYTDAAAVALNTTHRSSDGKDHSDVVLNNTHRSSDGKDHSDVVLNNTHRTSDGSDHSFIDQDVTTTGTPSFTDLTVTNDFDSQSIEDTGTVSISPTAQINNPPYAMISSSAVTNLIPNPKFASNITAVRS